jgi:hypothetical protein
VADSLRVASASEVVLGVRPEGAVLGNGAPGAVGTGWVYATEPVGSDLFVDLSFDPPEATEPELFKVRTRPDLRLRSGDRVSLSLPAESLYVFERSGRRIHPREPGS